MVRQWVLPIFLVLVSIGSVAKDKVQIDPHGGITGSEWRE